MGTWTFYITSSLLLSWSVFSKLYRHLSFKILVQLVLLLIFLLWTEGNMHNNDRFALEISQNVIFVLCLLPSFKSYMLRFSTWVLHQQKLFLYAHNSFASNLVRHKILSLMRALHWCFRYSFVHSGLWTLKIDLHLLPWHVKYNLSFNTNVSNK